MITILILCFTVAGIVSAPNAIRNARRTRGEPMHATQLLALLAFPLVYIPLGIYTASIGHGVLTFIIAIPAIIAVIVGIVLGVSWAIEDDRNKRPRSIIR